MPSLTAIPGLSPEAIEMLTSCGIESVEMLAGIPPAEIHRVLELTAWQKGKLNRAPTLDMVHHWAEMARGLPVPAGGAEEEIPEAIILPRAPASSSLPARRGYVPPSQRARLEAAGPPTPAAPITPLPPEIIPAALPAPVAVPAAMPPPAQVEPPLSRFNTFQDYQSGQMRVVPLNRFSIDAPPDPDAIAPTDPVKSTDDLPRTVRRGVVYPNPGLLVFGAVVSLLWRLALVGAVIGVPWLLFTVPRPSEHLSEILTAAGVLAVLGIAQLYVMGRVRCRICTCHLFYSRNTVKNRKAHNIPLFGKTASLSLHLLLFQWFRCMYCGTAIKLWVARGDKAVREE
jgi:hypothetical protein